MRKKLLSLALALAMCLGLTVPAFAANPVSLNMSGICCHLSDVVEMEERRGPIDPPTCYLAPDATITFTQVALEKDEEPWTSFDMEAFGTYNWAILSNDVLQFNTPYTYADLNRLARENSEPSEGGGNVAEDYFSTFRLGVSIKNGAGYLALVEFISRAMPTNDSLSCNGEVQSPTVYKINGSNYFKIRDLAAILNGTEKQFSVGYDEEFQSVTVTSGEAYTLTDTELKGLPAGEGRAISSDDSISINGEWENVQAYKIDGNNYFKLRDLGKALNFYVGWSAEQGVYIETDKPYTE